MSTARVSLLPRLFSGADVHSEPSTALLQLPDQLNAVGHPKALILLGRLVQGVYVGLAEEHRV